MFATRSVRNEDWEGQALRHGVVQTSGYAWALSDHHTHTTNQHAGAGHGFQQNARLPGVTAPSANQKAHSSNQQKGAGYAFEESPHLIGGTANQHAYMTDQPMGARHGFQQNAHLIGVTATTANQHAHMTDQPMGAGHGFQPNAHQIGVIAPTANQNPAHNNHSEFSRTTRRNNSPSVAMLASGNKNAPQPSPLNELSGEDGHNRRAASSAAQNIQTAAEMQKRIVTQHVTTTTTTNQTRANTEDRGMSANPQREDMLDPSALGRQG